MGSSFPGGEMCMEGGRPAGRRGAKKQAAADQKANRQPQRGLGVAQLEKIRLHNQMMAAYRSAGGGLHPATAAQPFAASSFQPYLADGAGHRSSHTFIPTCFEETERGIVRPVQQCHHPPPQAGLAHDARDSSGHRLGQPPPQQHYWMMSSASDGSRRSSHGSAEELDLELRL
ncbi:uncharacterized protein C2845_PM07G39910 [Panicum miliaceum]|uniref:Uncharacterized protein n=1 Tax=Panicum miliaceum TaxID=4540 RepID=A0A3L6SMB1_PANMI|nr:uncharacterized protein C2845_PM07G39910 [Panicum miliaceum]